MRIQDRTKKNRRDSKPARVAWPTLLVAFGIYSIFFVTTWFYHALPIGLVMLLGAYSVAWHGSLTHEVVHGHPTRKPWLNAAIVLPNLALWLPFLIYQRTHLQHHRNQYLTSPDHDPESYYLTTAVWAGLSRPLQILLWINNSLLGRLLLGPLIMISRFYWNESRQLLNGDWHSLRAWAWHSLAVAVVLMWVIGVCQIPLTSYLLFIVYPALSLTLLRSYAEHQARANSAERSVIVEAHPLLALLYLNNNLHALHHAKPGLPWYKLPAHYRQHKATILTANGGYYYGGYGEIIKRHWLEPKELPWQ